MGIQRIANRTQELRLFTDIVSGRHTSRILLIEGPSERGKSVLLAELASIAGATTASYECGRADLKGSLSLGDFVARLSGDLDATHFAADSSNVAITVRADLSKAQFGDSNTVAIQPVVDLSQSVLRAQRFIEQLREYAAPTILIIDTFEAAIEEVSRWVIQQLLPTVRHKENLFIILGGQTVPDPKGFRLTWGDMASHILLQPIESVDDWYDFARSKHAEFPRQHIESLCLGGLAARPSIIEEVIDTIGRQLPSAPL